MTLTAIALLLGLYLFLLHRVVLLEHSDEVKADCLRFRFLVSRDRQDGGAVAALPAVPAEQSAAPADAKFNFAGITNSCFF